LKPKPRHHRIERSLDKEDNSGQARVDEHMTRNKRHGGSSHEGGLQRIISTGSLAPPLLPVDHPAYARSMDVIFAAYWFYPAKTAAILPQDQTCIDAKMAQENLRFDPHSEFYGLAHAEFSKAVVAACLEISGNKMPDNGVYESQHTSNIYNMHMGQMTMYRLRLKCSCGSEGALKDAGERCAEFLPYEEQQWPAYMGKHGDSHWQPRTNR